MTEPTTGTRITSVDLATGESQTMTIHNDVCVIVDGTAYISGVNDFPQSGTQIWTIKGRLGRSKKER
jgi:hypothetical protein